MITVSETHDLESIRAFLSEPTMFKRLTRSVEAAINIESALCQKHVIYHVVKDGTDVKGFIAYQTPTDYMAIIHVCLKTIGERTMYALNRSFALLRKRGIKMILAAFSASRKDLRHLSDILGFVETDGSQWYVPSVKPPIFYSLKTL